MHLRVEGQNQRNGSMRRNNIIHQKNFEDQFQKPMADRNPKSYSDLYFQGKAYSAGRRINADKNSSSVERVFGLDDPA